VSPPGQIRTIVIADGLTKDVLSPDHPYCGGYENVGDREIERLFGRGKYYGEGPLPTFLRAVSDGGPANGCGLILLSPVGKEGPNGTGGTGTIFVEPIEELAWGAVIVPTKDVVIPADSLRAAFGTLGVSEDVFADTRFLVVGCHTDRRILGLASLLKNVWECAHVAISPHLVGSATQEAHFAALRHTLPAAGIEILLDLEVTAEYVGLETQPFSEFGCKPVSIEPPEALDALGDTGRHIVELLCLNWTRVRLRPLAGGFSGSLLFLADGWKGGARTEPLVVKIDAFAQMRRELNGYHQVKDFFGKHVPTFGYPIWCGDSIGVGMDLAAMEGRPQTLQDTFEDAESEEGLELFLLRLDKALALLSEKLYGNTKDVAWVVPYRAFGLHTEQQAIWMRENANLILSYLDEAGSDPPKVDPARMEKLLRLIAANEDGIDSEVCLCHGDLNLANVICDDGDNIWFIDWTHSGKAPLELDLAKLETDAKFVMSKEFDLDDLPRLRRFEEYLLSQRIPAEAANLPEGLRFVKWDLRFRKVLDAVRRIRGACFELKQQDEWLVYRVALLRHVLHTLSFDKRRDRGECELPQLMHALYSAENLVFDLVADDFHLKIRGERPTSYPPRLRISIDEAPWLLDCDEYDPPYHVDPSVLENDRMIVEGGWADPEDIGLIADKLAGMEARFRDDAGRPLNPHGRTGIAGRGLLGCWACNLYVSATVTRTSSEMGQTEILLGGREDQVKLSLPRGFVLFEETPRAAIARVLEDKVGWQPGEADGEVVFEGFTYDRRQTDHAWVETQAFLFHGLADRTPGPLKAGGEFDELRWWPLEAETVNRVPSDQARSIRGAVTRLIDTGQLDRSEGDRLLERTG
jgi:ADP-ribose pyrophosphatase